MKLEVAILLKAASFSACGVGMNSSKQLGINYFLSGLLEKTETHVLGRKTKGIKVPSHLSTASQVFY